MIGEDGYRRSAVGEPPRLAALSAAGPPPPNARSASAQRQCGASP